MKRCSQIQKKIDVYHLTAFRFLALSTVVPPGSIVVIPGGLEYTSQTLEFQSFNWTNIINGLPNCGILNCEVVSHDVHFSYPSPITVKLASQVAENMKVWDIPFPALNSSFSLGFFGPALQCGSATANQQTAFDFYNDAVYKSTGFITGPQYLAGHQSQLLLYYTAFSPQLYGVINNAPVVPGVNDVYANWNATLPAPYAKYFDPNGVELWVQLANQSIVCTLYNASYNVGFDYPNGIQNITHQTVTHLNKWTGNLSHESGVTNYMGVMASLVPMLYGNVTLLDYTCPVGGKNTSCYMLTELSSNILSSGLAACNEFKHSFWQDHLINGTTQVEQPDGSFLAFPSWQCRNKTVTRAIEDLMQNVTISLLGTSL